MIMAGIDGTSWRACRGYVEMCGYLGTYCQMNTCRLTCHLEWPGLWVASSTPAIHGILQGYEMPVFSCDLVDRHGSGIPSTLVIYQTSNEQPETELRKPLYAALPLRSSGLTMPQALIESLPPHVCETVQQRIRAINERMAEEIRELEDGSGHVGETEGKGDEGGCISVHVPGMVGI